jgi:hypothetical protein
MRNWFKRKPARASNLQNWVTNNFDAMPERVSGRELAEHIVVMLKLYNQDPSSALTIIDVAGSVFALELVVEESDTATKH